MSAGMLGFRLFSAFSKNSFRIFRTSSSDFRNFPVLFLTMFVFFGFLLHNFLVTSYSHLSKSCSFLNFPDYTVGPFLLILSQTLLDFFAVFCTIISLPFSKYLWLCIFCFLFILLVLYYFTVFVLMSVLFSVYAYCFGDHRVVVACSTHTSICPYVLSLELTALWCNWLCVSMWQYCWCKQTLQIASHFKCILLQGHISPRCFPPQYAVGPIPYD